MELISKDDKNIYILDFIIYELFNKRIERLKKQIESNNHFITLWQKDLKIILKNKKESTEYINYLIRKDDRVSNTLKEIKSQVEEGGLLTLDGLYNVLSKKYNNLTEEFLREHRAKEFLKKQKEKSQKNKDNLELEIMRDEFYNL